MEKALLIGSRALNHWDSTFRLKETTDWDVISASEIPGAEFHRDTHLNNGAFYDYASDDTVTLNGRVIHVINPVGLSIIKRSHLFRDLSFGKHIAHYHHHLQRYVEQYTDDDRSVLRERIALTAKQYPFRYPVLKKTVADFFDDAVRKVYDHDHLHELVAYGDVPLYRKMQRDEKYAWCEVDMWNTFSHEDKIRCIAEETYVIAIERFMVPKNWIYSEKAAYCKALEKVCTTLTSGWFRDYGIDHYPDVFRLFDREKFKTVRQKLEKQT
jgi:hypothetical protein